MNQMIKAKKIVYTIAFLIVSMQWMDPIDVRASTGASTQNIQDTHGEIKVRGIIGAVSEEVDIVENDRKDTIVADLSPINQGKLLKPVQLLAISIKFWACS
jgi:hypothetical protein